MSFINFISKYQKFMKFAMDKSNIIVIIRSSYILENLNKMIYVFIVVFHMINSIDFNFKILFSERLMPPLKSSGLL